jgi:cytochrome P450
MRLDRGRHDTARENTRMLHSFGPGIHYCLGATLGRPEVKVILEELTPRLPGLSLVSGQALAFPPNASFRGPSRVLVEF